MNSLNQDKMLPYVSEDVVPTVQQKPSLLSLKENKNGLASAAFITALCSIVIGLLIFPSLLGIALGVGALIVASKRGLSKKLPIISIVVSAFTLIASAVILVFLLPFLTPTPTPYVPSGYTHDPNSGIAYKYEPVSNIACDVSGACAYQVTLFQVEEGKCENGGTFLPELEDAVISSPALSESYEFPALKEKEVHKIDMISYSTPESRLVPLDAYPISCVA